MRKISILTVAFLTAFSGISSATVRPYMSTKLSYTDLKLDYGSFDESEGGASFSISYGASFNTVRAEFELSGTYVDFKDEYDYSPYYVIEKDTMQNTSFMINTFVDIPTKTIVIPYLGIGAGVAINSVDIDLDVYSSGSYVGRSSADTTKSKFAYQAMAGIAFELNNNFDLDIGYKYANYGKIEGIKASANMVSVGLRYNF